MKRIFIPRFVLLIVGIVVFLSGCSPAAEETPTLEPIAPVDSQFVSATGVVVPVREALLSVSAGGVVENVMVEKGDQVNVDQVLVQLEGTEQQAAVVTAADLELANARYALNALYKDTELFAAQALRSAETAERALEDLNNRELQVALAQKAVAEAQKAVDTTERNARYAQSTASQADIDAQKAFVVIARDALDKANEDFEPHANKPEDNLTRAHFLARQAAAQKAYDDAVRRLNAMQGTSSEVDINVAEAEYITAQAALLEAQRDLERVMDGPDPGEIALLEAQIEKGLRDYEIYNAGPDPDDITLAEARIANAEAQLAAAEEILADLELKAPFLGVVSTVYVNSSEWVAPGSPVLLMGDLDHLQIKTTDLSEIDVSRIANGDRAVITFDALPDLVVEGTVISIAPKAEEGTGVNFPVTIELDEVPPELRWGMTAFVDIDVSQ
jgi:HlyD family secretion protein